MESDERALTGMPPRRLLQEGGPWEILPSSLPRLRAQATDYCADADNPADARDRVAAVWLRGEQRPAWQPGSKTPHGSHGDGPS